jgi:membrane protease YdiL (CAAX protease family)
MASMRRTLSPSPSRPGRAPSAATARAPSDPLGVDSYWARSLRPLHMLVFLLPLVAAYELGSLLFLTDPAAGIQRSVEAYRLLGDFFHAFGIVGLFLPGIALVAVLLTWHLMLKDRWRVELSTLAGMLLESIAWTIPLLVLAAITDHARSLALAAAGTSGEPLGDLSVMSRLAIAIGAGLYEEMLFRLVGIALLHVILVDLIQMPKRVGAATAIVLSALAFAIYHRPDLPSEWGKLLFFTLSGIYLGTVYTMRGFGIVVGTHAMYDILVLVIFPALRSGPG